MRLGIHRVDHNLFECFVNHLCISEMATYLMGKRTARMKPAEILRQL